MSKQNKQAKKVNSTKRNGLTRAVNSKRISALSNKVAEIKSTAVPPLVVYPNPFELSGLNGTNGVTADERLGCSVSGERDVNGDGYEDVIIGTRHATPNGLEYAGESYVIFGGPHFALF